MCCTLPRSAFPQCLRLQGGIAGCIHSLDNAIVPDMRPETMFALEGAASAVRLVEERWKRATVFPKKPRILEEI